MPPASRGRPGFPKPSGGGVLPLLGAGTGRAKRRGGRAGLSGTGGRARLALIGAAALLLVVFTTGVWRQPGPAAVTEVMAVSKPESEIPSNTAGGDGSSSSSRPPRAGAGIAVEEADASGSEEEEGSTETGEEEGVGGEGRGAGNGDGGGGEDGMWGSHSAGLGPGAPGFPLGEDDIHVVFSTDCSNYQGWQAVVLFHSAILSGHTGPITQLISGCSEDEEWLISSRHEAIRHTSKHRLFFSPNYAIQNPQTGEEYPYTNKPNAMQLWFNKTEVHETVVALIDPDFIFLKPLTTYLSPAEAVVKGDGMSLEGLKLENGGWVRKGYPAGQRFGLPNWTHWDRTKICPENSVCSTVTASTAKRYYDLIPPYLAHQDDWRRLLPEWVDQAPKVYDAYPSLLAEQTAYATAAATLDLKHYRLNNYAIENEKVDYELWDPVDHQMDNVCDISIEPQDEGKRELRSFDRMPNFIHYCHMYRVGQWLFNKRRYRKERNYDQLQCDTPLLETPPVDVQKNAFKMHPGARYEEITPRSAKRNAFVLCTATRFVNSALRHYKGRMCAEGHPNLDQTVRIA